MYRETVCQNRSLEQYFRTIEDRRLKLSIMKMKSAIDNTFCIATDPTGSRIKCKRSQTRTHGMIRQQYVEVERQNKILLSKMGKIMQGDYKSSTLADFQSRKCSSRFSLAVFEQSPRRSLVGASRETNLKRRGSNLKITNFCTSCRTKPPLSTTPLTASSNSGDATKCSRNLEDTHTSWTNPYRFLRTRFGTLTTR